MNRLWSKSVQITGREGDMVPLEEFRSRIKFDSSVLKCVLAAPDQHGCRGPGRILPSLIFITNRRGLALPILEI